MTQNRIFFIGNPYPLGHAIKEFAWSGRLDEDGEVYFDFHLKTDDYYAEDPKHGEIWEDEEEEDKEDWDSKIVWGNFHSCTISSTNWGNDGILLDNTLGKLNFTKWQTKHLTADKLPRNNLMPAEWEWDDLAMHIYLLGHDACANHQIDIVQVEHNLFNIAWVGKIALAYIGQDEFKHDFSANMTNVIFDGFYYPQSLLQHQVLAQLSSYIENLDDFEFIDLNPKSNKRDYKLALKCVA